MSDHEQRLRERHPERESQHRQQHARTVLRSDLHALLRDLDEARAERDALRGLLARMIDMTEFWINRDKRPQMSEQEWRTWHACGHGSNAMLDAKAALAAKGEG